MNSLNKTRIHSTISDYFGSWKGMFFNSSKTIIEHTKSLGVVNRKLSDSTIKQDFRHYRNKSGLFRVIMLDVIPKDNEKKEIYTYIANKEFFKEFCDGMLRANEITDKEYETITSNLKKVN